MYRKDLSLKIFLNLQMHLTLNTRVIFLSVLGVNAQTPRLREASMVLKLPALMMKQREVTGPPPEVGLLANVVLSPALPWDGVGDGVSLMFPLPNDLMLPVSERSPVQRPHNQLVIFMDSDISLLVIPNAMINLLF